MKLRITSEEQTPKRRWWQRRKIASLTHGARTRVFDDTGRDVTRELRVFEADVHIDTHGVPKAVIKCHLTEFDIEADTTRVVLCPKCREPQSVESQEALGNGHS